MNKEPTNSLVRELGLTEALAIGLGTMIGAGIFVLSAIAAQRVGPAATLSYVLAGLICLPIAMTVSELATGMPKAGGSYHLISRALGPVAGAVVGPGNWLGLTFATGFYLIGFAQYVAYFLSLPPWATALGAGLFFVFLNYRGAKLSGRVQNIIVVLLILILALFVGRGLFNMDPELHRPFLPFGWGTVFATVGLIIVSFTGFEKISTIAEEIKRPARNLPLAIVGSVIIAIVLYAGILYVATGILSYRVIADFQAPLVEAANRFMSVVGIVGMSLAALLATASSANAAIMASSRINFAMGRDRIFPGWFNKIHPRYLTPYRSVLVTGGLAILLALSGQAAVLAEISSALFMVSYALLSLALLVMRRTHPMWYRPAYRVPFYPWLPVLGGVLALGVIGTMERTSQLAGLGLVGLSLGWYVVWGRRQTPVEGELMPWLERERPLEAVIADVEHAVEAPRNEILVPVANPLTAKSLVKMAAILGRAREESTLAVLSVVAVPGATSLDLAQDFLDRQENGRKALLKRVADYAHEQNVPVRTLLRAARGISSGILSVAEGRRGVGLILVGWRGQLSTQRVAGSVVKEVVRGTRCDVAVLRIRGVEKQSFKHVLVAVGGGPHARLALQLAWDIARAEKGLLTVLRILPQQGEVDMGVEMDALHQLARDELEKIPREVRFSLKRNDFVVEGILAATTEVDTGCDLIVIGASEEWFLRDLLVGSIPDMVAERALCSVLLVRKHEPSSVSWVRRMTRHVRSPKGLPVPSSASDS